MPLSMEPDPGQSHTTLSAFRCRRCEKKNVECLLTGRFPSKRWSCDLCKTSKVKCNWPPVPDDNRQSLDGQRNPAQDVGISAPVQEAEVLAASLPQMDSDDADSQEEGAWDPVQAMGDDGADPWGLAGWRRRADHHYQTEQDPADGDVAALAIPPVSIAASAGMPNDFYQYRQPTFEVPAEYFYIHNLYTRPWYYDQPNRHRTTSSKLQPDPVYPQGTGRRYFYWIPARNANPLELNTKQSFRFPEELAFASRKEEDTLRTLSQATYEKPAGPMGARSLAVRWVNWFELHSDIVLDQGRYRVEFMFKTMIPDSIPRKPEPLHGQAVDGWELPLGPLKTLHGINLRAGYPEIWENFVDAPGVEPLSKVGHLRDPDMPDIEVRQLARRCIDQTECCEGEWQAWNLDDGGQCLPLEAGNARRPEDEGVLEVLEDGVHVRLLAFQGSNKKYNGRGNEPRGRFLFGGARLTKVGEVGN